MSQTAEIMPSRSAFRPLREIQTIEEAVNHPVVIERFNKALPKGMRAESFLAKIRQLAMDDVLIRQVEIWEILRCAITLGDLGLVPNTPEQLAWMIPRKNNRKNRVDITIVIGYRGLLRLAWQSQMISNVHADVVYGGDDFSFHYGSDGHLRHRPRGPRSGREWEEAYAYVKLANGGELFERMHRDDVYAIRNDSDAYKNALMMKNEGKEWAYKKTPWVANDVAMSCKTLVRQIYKIMPTSTERFAQAIEIDGQADAGVLSFAGDPGDLAPPIVVDAPSEHTGFSQRSDGPAAPNNVAPLNKQQAPQGAAGARTAPPAAANADTRPATMPAPLAKVTSASELMGDQSPSTVKAEPGHLLFSVDGEILGKYASIDDYARAFLEHGNSVTGPEVEDYIEINRPALSIVARNETHRAAFVKAGLLPDDRDDAGNTSAADDEGDDRAANDRQSADAPKAQLPPLPAVPAGRGGAPDSDAFKRDVSTVLATLTTMEELNAWKTQNAEGLRALVSVVRSAALLAWTGRVREITTPT